MLLMALIGFAKFSPSKKRPKSAAKAGRCLQMPGHFQASTRIRIESRNSKLSRIESVLEFGAFNSGNLKIIRNHWKYLNFNAQFRNEFILIGSERLALSLSLSPSHGTGILNFVSLGIAELWRNRWNCYVHLQAHQAFDLFPISRRFSLAFRACSFRSQAAFRNSLGIC